MYENLKKRGFWVAISSEVPRKFSYHKKIKFLKDVAVASSETKFHFTRIREKTQDSLHN